MKARLFVIGLFLFTFVACAKKAQVPEPVEGPSPELSAIDSLLWHHPDSALMCLIPYFDTCCREAGFCVSAATAFNRHYAHLLLSELLYKNDYPQTNRMELLQAVAYFDSIAQVPESAVAEHSRSIEGSSKEQIIFLNARTHYINGVGYYENDSLVPACAEYLKTLEIMENHFEEKELIGHKARFMAYTYNRLGDMFSEQFMMEPAIDCYENALVFCRIEPTSPQGVSNILSRIGQQYDMKGEKGKARDYYGKALEEMPNSDNLSYRNLVSLKVFSDYKIGMGKEHPLMVLRQIITQTNNETERLTRFVLIGDIFFEEGMYDSAMFYLEPVFFHAEDDISRIQAAEYLHIIYDSIGDRKKLDECMRFLAQQKKTEGQNKALVSQLEGLFQVYLDLKQEKLAKTEREKAVKKAVVFIIPIAIAVALAIFIMAKFREKKVLKDKETHHQREMEAERQTHKMQQAALSGRLKRSNEELRDVSNKLEQVLTNKTLSEATLSDDYKAFLSTPICLFIVGLVHKQQFKSKMDYLIYKDDALSKEQLLALRNAAEQHLARFISHLRKRFPSLTDIDMDYCYLILLGLNEADISALLQKAYTTVCDRNRKINRIVGATGSLYHTFQSMLSE